MSFCCHLPPGTAGTASGLIINQGRGESCTQARADCVIARGCVSIPAPPALPKSSLGRCLQGTDHCASMGRPG